MKIMCVNTLEHAGKKIIYEEGEREKEIELVSILPLQVVTGSKILPKRKYEICWRVRV